MLKRNNDRFLFSRINVIVSIVSKSRSIITDLNRIEMILIDPPFSTDRQESLSDQVPDNRIIHWLLNQYDTTRAFTSRSFLPKLNFMSELRPNLLDFREN